MFEGRVRIWGGLLGSGLTLSGRSDEERSNPNEWETGTFA
jgi:hypothetical protein